MADLYADTGRVYFRAGPAIMFVDDDAGIRMLHALGNAGSVIAHLPANALGMRRI
ncbi:MAG TPA: hypothetical protein VHD86_03140 [Xanthobacteraceae bacterium]|nr:hypothetical protein [Xanthobacteraceae bacterium]